MYYVYDFVLYAIPVLMEAFESESMEGTELSGGSSSGGGIGSRLGTDDSDAIRACASSQIKESRLVIEDCGRTFKFYFE